MVENRKKLAKDLGIPTEDASRILIEKEKAVKQSEVKYHVKAMCQIIDSLRQNDAEFAESVTRETVKYLLSRHGSGETLEDVGLHIETLSEHFMERIFSDRMRDEY